MSDDMAEQNDMIRAQLDALDKGGRKWLKRCLLHEIRCSRCGDPLVQLVDLKPYRVVRFRQITQGDGAQLSKWIDSGIYESTPDPVRLDPWWKFFPIAANEPVDDSWLIFPACRCGQFELSMRGVLSRRGTSSTATPSNAPTRDNSK